MGCSCNKNKAASSSFNTNRNVGKKEVKKEEPIVVVSGNSPAPVVREQGVCDKMYDELTSLDAKTYDLFQRTKFDNTGEDYQWLQVQRQIREWKRSLKDKCPEEGEMDVVRNLVNTEYAKLF